MMKYIYTLITCSLSLLLYSCETPVCCGPQEPTGLMATVFTNENTNYLRGLDTTTFKFYFIENNEKKFLKTNLYFLDQDTSYFQGMYISGANELHQSVPN